MNGFVALATVPGYCMIAYLWFSAFMMAAFDCDVSKIADSAGLALVIEGLCGFITIMLTTRLYIEATSYWYPENTENKDEEEMAGV